MLDFVIFVSFLCFVVKEGKLSKSSYKFSERKFRFFVNNYVFMF